MTNLIDSTAMSHHIYFPIHNSVLDRIKEMYLSEKHQSMAIQLISKYYESLGRSTKYIPLIAYVNIKYIKINPQRGLRRNEIKKQIDEEFFDILPYCKNRFSHAYRLKEKYIYSEYSLMKFDDVIVSEVNAFDTNSDCRKNDPISYDLLSKLDLSACNLKNEKLLNDLKNRASKDVESSFIRYEKAKNKVRIKISTKDKQLWGGKKSPKYKLYDADKVQYILEFEKEQLFQRKKYLLNNCLTRPINIKIGITGGRLHSNITQIPSEALKHVKLDNQKLIEFDMKNCHYQLFSNELLNHNTKFYQYLNECTNNEYSKIHNLIKTQLKCYQINGKVPFSPRKKLSYSEKYIDLIIFINWSFEGELYEKLSVMFWGEVNFTLRNRAKVMLMGIFYGSPNVTSNGKSLNLGVLSKLFHENFPTVSFLINRIKNYSFENWDTVKEYDIMKGVRHSIESKNKPISHVKKSCLSVMLQRIESRLFVEALLPYLRGLKFDVITKHDSIICKSEDEYKVRIAIEKKIRQLGHYNMT